MSEATCRPMTLALFLAIQLACAVEGQPSMEAMPGAISLLGQDYAVEGHRPHRAVPLSGTVSSPATGSVTIQDGAFFRGGKPITFIGGNWSGLGEGRGTFGSNLWLPDAKGFSGHADELRAKMKEFASNRINLIRMWLLECDGRFLLDEHCRVTGLDETYLRDVRTLLDIADECGIKVTFVLFDFIFTKKLEWVGKVPLFGRRRLFEDPATRRRVLDDLIDPILKSIGDHPALLGFDVFNEPEWCVSVLQGGRHILPGQQGIETAIPIESLRSTFADVIARIRAGAPGKLVTVGTSAPCVRAMTKGVAVDYHGVHYYPWMKGLLGRILGLDAVFRDVPKDRPWIVEEFCGFGTEDPALMNELLDCFERCGASGALVWMINPGTGDHSVNGAQNVRKAIENMKNWSSRRQS